MGLLAAIHFLTTVPLTPRRVFTERELGASLAFYPIVGSLIGVVLIGVQFVASLAFDARFSAVLLLGAWVLVTGALHLDGFMDACDGLLSHRASAERLRIMRDVHVGAWGVIGVVLLLVAKFALLQSADGIAL
ncbi:MAG: adenosylcobinamide-GDP ribazoletransferase, partial [Chloroflexi bacterium]|nr:adenosylcobinamide-GDP ribazoletransferase [Chloroflexota bacterium]